MGDHATLQGRKVIGRGKINKNVCDKFGNVNYNLYLCIDGDDHLSGWGNNTSWSVDSNLPLYIIKDPQPLLKAFACLFEFNFLYLRCYEKSTYYITLSPL